MNRYNDLARSALLQEKIVEFMALRPFKPRYRKWFELWRIR